MNSTGAITAVTELFDWTWRTSLGALLLIALVALAQRSGRGWLTAKGRYALSCLVLLRLLVPFVPASPFSLLNLPTWCLPLERAHPSLKQDPRAVSSPLAAFAGDSFVPGVGAATPAKYRAESALAMLWLGGMLASLGKVFRQHSRFCRWLRTQPRANEQSLLELVDWCKERLGVSQAIELVLVQETIGPAVAGWRQPKLLLSVETLALLERNELRLVLMHELAHVRRHDPLLNWLLILVRAWHWFNPLVGAAFRRLQADRELVCDAMVLHLVNASEQRLYGHTLLKLLEAAGPGRLAPALLSVVNHKNELKERMTMITRFKPNLRTAWTVAAVQAVVLVCLTFTRAADPNKKGALANTAPVPSQVQEPASGESQPTGMQALEHKVQEQDDRVLAAQRGVDAWRRKLGGLTEEAGETLAMESIRSLTRDLVAAETKRAQCEALNRELQNRDNRDLRQMLPTAAPDTLLNGLLERLSITETELARVSSDHGPEMPQVKAITSGIANLNKQIDLRMAGILAGLRSQIASAEATSASLRKSIEEAKEHEAAMSEAYIPYFQAKRELETRQRIREALMQRLLQEQVDGLIPRGPK